MMTLRGPAGPSTKSTQPRNIRLVYVASVCLGIIYGVLFRLGTSGHFQGNGTATMTVSFLVLGSLMIGLLAVYPVERATAQPIWRWFLLPMPPIVLACCISLAFRIEGLICMIFVLPGALLCSIVGGVLGGVLARVFRVRQGTVTCLAVMPFILAPLETLISPPVQMREVRTEIAIHAPASVVWRNIERVKPIASWELKDSWAQRIGFPRPVEATLSYEGVGGVRHASFERGLLFLETVNAWEPEKLLAFSIRADSSHIPSATLDQHVTIGGRYFDVLDGEYRLEPVPDGTILLHLSSRQRLSTDFNPYAGLWTDAVMRTLQNSILGVIKARCEREAQSEAKADQDNH
ncbi:MAG: hypothetical protein ACRYFU_20915 [Janthinobacterium lividum]